MTKIMAERLNMLVSLVGALAFAVGFATSSQGVVALGVVGFAYMATLLPLSVVLVIATDFGRSMWKPMVVVWPLLLAGMLWAPPTLRQRDLDSFGPYQVLGVVVFTGAIAMLGAGAYARYRDAHKECPDCAETVLARAKVCRYCGFRWEERPAIASANGD